MTSPTASPQPGAPAAAGTSFPLEEVLNRELHATLGASMLAAVQESAGEELEATAGGSGSSFGSGTARATVAECVARQAVTREGSPADDAEHLPPQLPAALIGGERSGGDAAAHHKPSPAAARRYGLFGGRRSSSSTADDAPASGRRSGRQLSARRGGDAKMPVSAGRQEYGAAGDGGVDQSKWRDDQSDAGDDRPSARATARSARSGGAALAAEWSGASSLSTKKKGVLGFLKRAARGSDTGGGAEAAAY